MNAVNLFLKCGNYNKSRFYEQILKIGTHTFRKFFLISYAELTLDYSSLHNRVSKILRLNVGFVFKLTVFYFIGTSKKRQMRKIFKISRTNPHS
ncbi:hypothetical protein LEP1GSC036_1624 [Leptospira weilii str. 2006001853]|uniref:Uncharacterized protein n=1 Tax=Leptospira weilii str. 2006001853 TaxID=1001589 RepID=A0A828YYB0_9LEPT|nr:hypothetical protein LEP1GSC036_1624 [Leptospira weilii str. 2006001853]OMI18131.1 hypothetical protein BUQ74_06305 [Leptospira weilii serovar Heyan]